MTLYREPADAFTHDHQRILQTISAKASVTIENALVHTRAEKDAGTDQLTGLANAHSLTLHLAGEVSRLEQSGGTLAVLVLDLDGFKAVNDRFGHLAGNRVLELVAAGLREHCRPNDFIARMGGDEFVLVIPGLTTRGLDEKREQLTGMVAEVGRRVCGARTALSLSLGEAYYPADGEDVETLLSIADQRMYRVKRQHHIEGGLAGMHEPAVALTVQ
jgi:diguanylate cyclase (GGDEF)-like protein